MNTVFSFLLSLCLMFVTLCSGALDLPELAEKKNAGRVGDTLTLPLEGGSDPWYYAHEGMYYYCYSIGEGVAVRRSDRVSTLGTGEEFIVYRAPLGTEYSWGYWAPELHFIDGSWYIYVAACDGNDAHHRMYVLKSDSPVGQFQMLGKIADPTDKWAIDGTVLEYENELYFLWSGWEGDADGRQDLYIAHMSDPAHIDSERHLLSKPTHAWEKKGLPINEGPAVLKKDGKIYVVYSASGSWTDDYCLGMISFCSGDLLDRRNWAKCPVPVFSKRETAYGPGHCSFLRSADGNTDYIVYHANLVSGTGWNGRTVRIQPFAWVGDVPVFGRPLKEGSRVTVY